MKKYFFLILIMSFILSSCVIIKEMIPQIPSKSYSPQQINVVPKEDFISEDKIQTDYFFIKGFDEKHTPPNVEPTKKLKDFLLETTGTIDLNRSAVARFFNKDQKSERIIIITPGIFSGAGTSANLAKAIVRRNPDTEVWVWERRANQLEDRRLLIKSIKDKNKNILLNLLKPGTLQLKENSYYQPSTEDISFAAYWGLNVQLVDLYNVIKEARLRTNEVILSGYSLGVLYTTMFLAHNFGSDQKGVAGYRLVDKAILFDGPPMIDGYVGSENIYKSGMTIYPSGYIDGKDKLESGKYYPCNGNGTRNMNIFYLMNLKAILALLDPHGISPEPYKYGSKKYPITNLANFAISTDDNYASFKLFTATFGKADAKHTGKFSYSDMVTITGQTNNKSIIDWILPDINDKVEFNNLNDYLLAESDEYFDMPEWYQPTRILLDFGSIHKNDTSTGWQKKYFRITENKNINIPFLCIGLTRGLSSRMENYNNYKKIIKSNSFDMVLINSLTHLDGDTASDTTNRQYIADVVTNWLNNKEIIKNGELPK